ncbi:MAG: D-alanyl-D-alanine carboxypeptidase/D-alanyl-D-alanine-endopeptidase [Gemmatimonadota bacterium]
MEFVVPYARPRRIPLQWIVALASLLGTSPAAAQGPSLADRITKITERPEFKGALFGIKVVSLDRDSVVFSLNSDKLFVPGSTTKLLTVGTALQLLGSDYRFHTKVYRTGPVGADGTLRGDLVLVASGDPNLSHRIRGDSLLFVDEDHSYGNDPATDLVAGDPLQVLRKLAGQVKAHGIKRITGSVRVDASLYDGGERELGTGVMISPIVVNDNIVDIVIAAGDKVGAPAKLTVQPTTGYVHVINKIVTGSADSASAGDITTDSLNHDGTRTIVLTGRKRIGGKPGLLTYKVAEPDRYAAAGLVRALQDAGIVVTVAKPALLPAKPGRYAADQVVAEHVSPPFREAAKVILKVSQNLHASAMPYVLGAVLKGTKDAQGGFDLEHEFLTKAGLDLAGAVQSDGAGGSALYTPDFMVSYLRYMATQKSAADFIHALPILGRDGTLAKISRDAPAAGHVFAKTGTLVDGDLLNRGLIVQGKGLAGYLTTRSGQRLVIAIYINRVKVSNGDQIQSMVGQAAGDVAAAIYDAVP